jgi:GNAT superfamily N-acetyltransferase
VLLVTVSVTTYYLEMTSPAELRAKRVDRPGLAVGKVPSPMPELNRFFYTAIGGDWFWTDRLPWSYQKWMEYLNRPDLQTWVVSVDGVPAGYFELEKQPGDSVEIAYFGLLPQFVGQGVGGYALTQTIERAWAMPAKRVWVHTCTLDHPSALANYQARGLRLYKQETEEKELPAPPGPWPGARPGPIPATK